MHAFSSALQLKTIRLHPGPLLMSGISPRYTPQSNSSALPTFPGQFAVGGIKTNGFSALNGGTSSSSTQRYDPYAPPQTNGAYASTSTAAAASRAIGRVSWRSCMIALSQVLQESVSRTRHFSPSTKQSLESSNVLVIQMHSAPFAVS